MPKTSQSGTSTGGPRGEAARLAWRLRALELENKSLTARLAERDAELAALRRAAGDPPEANQAAYFAAADESPIMLWVYDADDSPVFYNRAALAFLGMDHATALTSDIHDLVHPDDRARIQATDRESTTGPRPFRNEYRMRRADGQYRWVLDMGMPRLAADGTFLGSAGCCLDITEQRRALDALRESEAALARAQRTAKIGSWRWNAGDEASASGSAEFLRLLGLKGRKALTCRDIYRVVDPEDRRRLEETHAHAARTACDYRAEYRVRRPNGTVRHLLEIGEARRDEAGRLIEHCGTLQDVTERKDAEANLRRAMEEAQLANKAKSDFLANMSHELRTPLNAVLGFAEIMNREMHGPLGHAAYAGYVEDIHQSGRLLLELINDILDLSKVETGNATLDEAEIDLDELLRACLRFVSERAKENGLALSAELTGGATRLQADPRKLKQIVINLLNNAVKFTPNGGSVTLRCRATASEGCVIEIADTGIGMAKRDIPKALDRFHQLEDGLIRRQEGTGLGLPLSKALAELHGGTLELASRRGKGTTVTLRLPARRLLSLGAPAPVKQGKTDGLASAG